MSIGKLVGVSVAGEQLLALTWDDGHTANVDLSGVITGRKALAELADPSCFGAVALSDDGWSIEWPQDFDFGTAQLRRWADEQSGEAMTMSAFRAWMETHTLTLDRAAEALGLSRRTIAYYLSGEQPVPKTVMLATEGYARRLVA
jgi:Protein of unknown function (DUF2442)